ncbi:MAG TPA: tRNA (N(6)-L-threonylcarbamoyladenosine(37)-C(2))-methylthiotransferase [Candidatus Saccharimonadales bacterium]|nr:tRNA (N(6)-L-threonylcarbamoyladenosine(37)-C(2))-methylthiotransferase [Candidatus Saccharimonadales bacterium]
MHNTGHLNSLKPDLIEKITLINTKKVSKVGQSMHTAVSLSQNNSINYNKSFNFWIEAYGCSANFSDMEMISGTLQQKGFNLVTKPELADINLIVTCSVKSSTEHKMINRIKSLGKMDKPLVIAGCLPAADERMVKFLSPEASLIGPDSIQSITEVTYSALKSQRMTKLSRTNQEKINLPKVRLNPIISIIQISTGCLSECTFCQTKLAKGNLKSFRIGKIINQINSDIELGSKEIWLTSTDNGCYGLDIGTNIVNLLRRCEQLDRYFKIRLGMLNPMYLKNLNDDICSIYSTSNKLFKFIHIPIQSGSESVLRKMKRGHTINSLMELIDILKSNIPDITIATDIITGFPTETDEDFEDTLKVIRNIEPDIVNSSKFSSRPGTLASKMVKVKDKTISKRSEMLHKLIKTIAFKNSSKWKGWKGEILLDDIENGLLKGRNDYYKSIALTEDPHNVLYDNLGKQKKNNHRELHTDRKNSHGDLIYKRNLLFNNPLIGKRIIVKVFSNSNHTLNAIPLEIVE